jgi:uncharacterized protein VirK/YbjX
MSQLITLSSGLTGTSGGLSRLRETIKLKWRALGNRQATLGWLELLNSHPLFVDLIKARPRLLYKIYRPYLSNTLDCQRRLALLQDHYRFIFRHGLGPLVVQAARRPVVLGGITGKSGLPYRLQLCAIEPLEREGELVLQLMQGDTLVYSTAFSFFNSERGMTLGIGCMQGPQGEHGLQAIKDATRELHGLRPKNLMVRLLRQLGHEYGCHELRLVGNANRALTSSATRKGKVHADYDGLWQELEAWPRTDGDYQLACEALGAPDMAAIPSKKRSEARKRHDTLEQLIAAVRNGLQAPRFEAVATPLTQNYATLAPANAMDEEFSSAVA